MNTNTNTKTDISFDRLKEVLLALKDESLLVDIDSEQASPLFTFKAWVTSDEKGGLGKFENLSEFLVVNHQLFKTLQINYKPNATSYVEMQEQLLFLSEIFPSRIYQSFDKYLEDNDEDVKANQLIMKTLFFNCPVVETIYDIMTVCVLQGNEVVVLERHDEILKKYIAFRNKHDVKLNVSYSSYSL